MKLVCDYEIFGEGNIVIELSEVDNLTPGGVERWIDGRIWDAVRGQFAWNCRLRPRYSEADLLEAIEAERKEREG